METVFFWIAWGLISFWAIKTFYFSYNKEKVKRLRLAALGINLSVLVLFFLPWLPGSKEIPQLVASRSGWQLFTEGYIDIALFFILLLSSIILFSTASNAATATSDGASNNKSGSLLKIASSFNIINSILIFVIMMRLMPGTFKLKLNDIAPIITALMLLIGNVVVLLLWQQLQLKEKKT